MGCCISTNKPTPPPKFHKISSRSSRAPPPVDVETVKEVLSETPNPNPSVKNENSPIRTIQQQNHTIHEDLNKSEISSLMSETVSTTTFDDDIDVFRRIMIDRSPVKSTNRHQLSAEFQPVKKSPVRGKEQSRGRGRLGSERKDRGTVFGSGRQRTGSGNVSTARSRSPAKRTLAGGGRNEIERSLSGRRTGKSPGRVVSDLHERVRKPELRSDRKREASNLGPTATNNDESLENPLVSLECFIFL